jgi:carbonic anhydrase
MKSIDRLLANNKSWAKRRLRENPRYFSKLAKIQKPRYLWIGCSDARVPANTIVGLNPGEVFVHRNVANQVGPGDLNCLSVIQFAVEVLKVRDVIVCGHYGCGGIRGSLDKKGKDPLSRWLSPVRTLFVRYQNQLEGIADLNQRLNCLCEINIHQQVLNACRTPSVQRAWREGRKLSVHGIVYDIHDGLIDSLDLCISSKKDLDRIS